MILLRAHHLLCIRNFKGKGYSQDFIDNFYIILKKLQSERIKIVTSVDEICQKCPHNKNSKCMKKPDSEEKVKQMDSNIIQFTHINLNEHYSYSKLLELTRNINPKDFCKECEWRINCSK